MVNLLLVAWQFYQLWGDSNPGQQSILASLGQKSRMPTREQWFLIIYKDTLPSRPQSQVLICGAAISTRLQRTAVPHSLLGRQSILICLWMNSSSSYVTMGCLQSQPGVSSAKFVQQPFSQALGGEGGGVSSPCFCQDSVHLNSAGTTSGKQGQQFLYKLMGQDKDRSPLQMNNSTRQGQQSFVNEYH